jgi:hypothetical protein
MPSDLQTVVSDPAFGALSTADKAAVLARVDPSFSSLSSADQSTVLARVGQSSSLSDQARARHAQLISETQGQIDPRTGEPTYAGIGVGHELAQSSPVQFARGALKGAGSTAYNLGEMVRHVTPGVGSESGPNDITRALEPTNTAQKVGKTAEQMAEFFAPGGTSTIRAASKLPTLARAGIEAASAAGVGAAQGENPLITGAAGAAGPLVGRLFQKSAPGLVNNLVDAGIGDTGASMGRAVTENGIVAPWMGDLSQLTREAQAAAQTKGPIGKAFGSLLEKTLATKEAIGKRVGAAFLQNPNGMTAGIDAEPMFVGPIDAAIRDTTVAKSAGPLEKAKAMLYEAFKTRTASGSANSASPAELWEIRDSIDSLIYGERKSTEGALGDVLKEVRTNLSNAIVEKMPEIKALNQQYSDISQAVDSVVDTLKKGQNTSVLDKIGKAIKNPYTLISGGGAYWLGGAPAVGAVIGARAGLGVLGTTPVATAAAQGAKALGSPAAEAIMSRGGAGIAGQIAGPSEPLTESLGSQMATDKYGHDSAVQDLLSQAPQGDPTTLHRYLDAHEAVYVNPDGTTGATVPYNVMQQFVRKTTLAKP